MARRAPSPSDSSLAKAICGWTLPPSPQSVEAMTFLPAHNLGETDNPVRHKVRVLYHVGRVGHDAGDDDFALGELGVLPDSPLVLVAHVGSLEGVTAGVDLEHRVHQVREGKVRDVRAVPGAPAEMEADLLFREAPQGVVQRLHTLAVSGALALAVLACPAPLAHAVGEGPNYDGNGQITNSKLATYDQIISFLKDQDARQPAMELEVIGQTVKGRDIHLVKYISDPATPTILYLTQQHGNEQLTTEGALEFIKHLGTGKSAGILDGVNILVVPMLNADGAMGDVNFSLEDYIAKGDRNMTRYNAQGVDLNRDHVAKIQPETQALHNNVMSKYRIDYMIDLHHQGTRSPWTATPWACAVTAT